MNINEIKNLSILPQQGKSIDVGDWKVTTKISSRDTDGKFSVITFNFKKGFNFAMNKHTQYHQFTYVVSGKLKIIENNKTVDADPGYINFLPTNTPHQFEALEDSELLIVYMPGGLEEIVFEMGELIKSGKLTEELIQDLMSRYGSEFC